MVRQSDAMADQEQTQRDPWAIMLDDPAIAETGGEHSNEGTDFARYWAISRLLTLEEQGVPDYAFLFEYLQDITLLDSPAAPTSASVYQIKKKERSPWKRSQLCSQKSTAAGKRSRTKDALKGRSPLGKLYLCVEQVSAQVKKADGVFVSNSCCDLKSSKGGPIDQYCRVPLSSLDSADLDFIERRIARELRRARPLPHIRSLDVEHTAVAPGGMRDMVQGMASGYLEKHQPSLPPVPGRLVEKLFESFSNRSGRHHGMSRLSEIVEKKGFTRKHFTTVLSELAKFRSAATMLDAALEVKLPPILNVVPSGTSMEPLFNPPPASDSVPFRISTVL